jgi:hypothetical protein
MLSMPEAPAAPPVFKEIHLRIKAMETKVVLNAALTNHLNKVRVLLTKSSDGCAFNVKCANSSFGYYELIALDTSSYEGQTLKKAAIDIVEVPSPVEREGLLASIAAYYQLVQSKANAAGKISKRDMLDVLNSLYDGVRMAA